MPIYPQHGEEVADVRRKREEELVLERPSDVMVKLILVYFGLLLCYPTCLFFRTLLNLPFICKLNIVVFQF